MIKPETLIVVCSDPEVKEPLNTLIGQILKLEEDQFVLISIPGGVSSTFERDPLQFQDYMRYTVQGGFKKIVFVSHSECSWYKHTCSLTSEPYRKEQQVTAMLSAKEFAKRVLSTLLDEDFLFYYITEENTIESISNESKTGGKILSIIES